MIHSRLLDGLDYCHDILDQDAGFRLARNPLCLGALPADQLNTQEFSMSYSETAVLLDSIDQSLAVNVEPINVKPRGHEPSESTSERISQLVRMTVSHLPMPEENGEKLRFRMVLDHLANGNAYAAAYEITAPTTGFSGTYVMLPTYSAIISSLDALAAAGHIIPGSDHLLSLIRNQARNEIIRLPVNGDFEWIVPFSTADRTAAHVAALIFTRLGALSRPWLWDAIPERGRFLILGREALLHPENNHYRCNGCLTFFDAAHRLSHL